MRGPHQFETFIVSYFHKKSIFFSQMTMWLQILTVFYAHLPFFVLLCVVKSSDKYA